MQSNTATCRMTGKVIPVVAGRTHSPHKGRKKNHEKACTRRHVRIESGTLAKGKDRTTDPLYLALESERDRWEKRRNKDGHVITGEHVIHQLRAATEQLLLDNGIDPSKPVSPMCLDEPLVSRHVSTARGYKELEHGLKKVRKLQEPVTAGGKGARPKLGKPDPVESQYVRPDGTVPLAKPEVKRADQAMKALKKEHGAFKVSIMLNRIGYLPKDRPHNACLTAIAEFFKKDSDGWYLDRAARDACKYTHPHYKAAWERICETMLANQ